MSQFNAIGFGFQFHVKSIFLSDICKAYLLPVSLFIKLKMAQEVCACVQKVIFFNMLK